MSGTTEAFLIAHEAEVKFTSNVLSTATGNTTPWDGEDFSKNFPAYGHLLVEDNEIMSLAIPMWLTVFGKPVMDAETATSTSLAIIMSATPIGMSVPDKEELYRRVTADLNVSGDQPMSNIAGHLPSCKLTQFVSNVEGEIATELKEYLTGMDAVDRWSSGTVDSKVKVTRDSYYPTSDTELTALCVTFADLWKTLSTNMTLTQRGFALFGASLYLTGVLKGLPGLQSRMLNAKIVSATHPTTTYLAEGFCTQRKVISTTLCLVDHVVSKGKIQLLSDSQGYYERFVMIRFRNVKLSLPSTVDSARRSIGVDLKFLIQHTLMKSTEGAWNRLLRYASLIDTGSVTAAGSHPSPDSVSSLSHTKIPNFVAPYVRLYNDKCLNEFGTRGNEMLVCICAGLGSGKSRGGGADWLTHLNNYQPYKDLPDYPKALARAAIIITRNEALGVTETEDNFAAGRAAQALVKKQAAEQAALSRNIRGETAPLSTTVPSVSTQSNSRSSRSTSRGRSTSVTVHEQTGDERDFS